MMNVVDDESSLSGNLDDLQKSLREEAATLAGGNKAQSESPAPAPQDKQQDEDLPEKFRGKSVKDIYEAYKQLESQYGRMANDLGQQRAITDRILNLRREQDLKSNGSGVTQPELPKIKATDLAEDPTGSIEKVVNARLAREQQEAVRRAEEENRNLAAQRFVSTHPDYQEFVNNAEFMEWVNASPVRRRAASAVQSGDFDAGSDLLTEFKEHRAAKRKMTDDNKNLDAARAASLESGSRGNGDTPKGSGKIYNRADLLRLQMTNPDLYYSDEYQAVIMKAYAEKRVR
jgi:hypothetical protein